MRVEHLMSRNVVTVSPETSLKEVAEQLVARRISGVPVCDGGGRLLGVVSEADVLQQELGVHPDADSTFEWLFGHPGARERLAARTAGEAMSSPAITIDAGRPVTEAAALLLERRIGRLPVVHGGALVGILTRADLVRAFSRTDEEIEREIREDVLLRTLWIEPSLLEVDVDRGEVTLAGRVGTRTEAELAAAYVGRVPGVVAVHVDLTWEDDDLARRSGRGAWHAST